jgi:hypothetical protein
MIRENVHQNNINEIKIEAAKNILSERIQGKRVIVFSEFHTLRMDLPWFIKNILIDFPTFGIFDLVTEVINVEVGIKWDDIGEKWDKTNWEKLCQHLKEYPSIKEFKVQFSKEYCEGYRNRENDNVGYDIGEERSWREFYWIKKASWLRRKLAEGDLHSLDRNFSWAHSYDAVLLLIVAAVDLGVRIYGVSTPLMMMPKGTGVFESVDDITTNSVECVIHLLRETDKKVACYLGRAHASIPQLTPSLSVSVEKMGSGYIQVGNRNKKYLVDEVVFNGSNFTLATIFINEGYLHVELFVGGSSDFEEARSFLKIEDPILEARIKGIKDKLGGDNVIEVEPVVKNEKGEKIVARNTVSLYIATKANESFSLELY